MPPSIAAMPGLETAYRATRYVVRLPEGMLSIRVGAAAPALDRWLRAGGWRCWSWLTAVNPESRLLDAAENLQRMARLHAMLEAKGLHWQGGSAISDDGAWPEEPSVFVPGLACPEAEILARCFGQAALLHGTVGGLPELVWLSAGPSGRV